MKKILNLLILALLFSCDGNVTSSDNLKGLELSNDLKTLLISKPSNDRSGLPFESSCSITPSTQKEGYYIASCYFAYRDVTITGIHFIALPYSYDITNNVTNVANVGYDGHLYSLSEEIDIENYTFKSMRISFLMNNNTDGIKVFFKSNSVLSLTFSFDNDEIIK